MKAQRISGDETPYVPLWYRTNLAVFQPDLEGVTLSPIADFMFRKNVRRRSVAQ